MVEKVGAIGGMHLEKGGRGGGGGGGAGIEEGALSGGI